MNRREFLVSSSLSGSALLGFLGSSAFAKTLLAGVGSHPLLEQAVQIQSSGGFNPARMSQWANLVRNHLDPYGRTTETLQQILYRFELEHTHTFDRHTHLLYQQLAGQIAAKVIGPIQMPLEDRPLWQLEPHPLANYQSTPNLPHKADFLIIGAGLTGTSAAYHLAKHTPPGTQIVILDANDPACESTGKNGGNFELIPESFMGTYEGLPKERFKFVKDLHPKENTATIENLAQKQARAIFAFCHRNSSRMTEIATLPGIDCDFSPNGWLRIASSKIEENGLREEVEFARNLGITFQLWSPEQIQQTLKVPAKFWGRLAPKSGNYHPFKFTNSVLSLLLSQTIQKIALHTRTRVEDLVPQGKDRILIKTSRGEILARRAILATNAFSATLVPELKAIQPYQSQIMNLEHVTNTIRNMTITENQGDLYYNFPLSKQYSDDSDAIQGTVHVGGGLDRLAANPYRLERSLDVMNEVKTACDTRFPDTKSQPPSRVWTGPMGFTRDRLPILGPLVRKKTEIPELVIAAGFNGYGGSFCIESGYVAAAYALHGKAPTELDAEVFSPRRIESLG